MKRTSFTFILTYLHHSYQRTKNPCDTDALLTGIYVLVYCFTVLKKVVRQTTKKCIYAQTINGGIMKDLTRKTRYTTEELFAIIKNGGCRSCGTSDCFAITELGIQYMTTEDLDERTMIEKFLCTVLQDDGFPPDIQSIAIHILKNENLVSEFTERIMNDFEHDPDNAEIMHQVTERLNRH